MMNQEVKNVEPVTRPIGKQLKRFVVHLDHEPDVRWADVIKEYTPMIQHVHEHVMSTLPVNRYKRWAISKLISLISSTYYLRDSILYKDELTAISRATNIPFGDLVLMQIMYEMSASCTSIVYHAKTKQGHVPIHLRTMDWDLPLLKDLTIQVDFRRGNETVCHAVTWAGYVGILTGMRPGRCSISLNYRETGKDLIGNVMKLIGGQWPAGYLIREVITDPAFIWNDAIHMLKTESLVAPCYLTICGVDSAKRNEHMVLTRGPDTCDVRYPNEDAGLLIQTNADVNSRGQIMNNGRDILYSHDRDRQAHELIKFWQSRTDDKITENVLKTYISSMCDFPILNEETIYLVAMCPSENKLDALCCC